MRAGARVVMALALIGATAGQAGVRAGEATLTYRGCHRLPEELRGLSGITHVGDERYYAVADNSDRVYPLVITLKEDGEVDRVRVEVPLRLPRRGDHEGIAFSGTRNSLLVSDESPAISQYQLPALRPLRAVPVPEVFGQIVANQGFESLALSPDGKTLWTANERALKIDGNPQTPATPIFSITRIRLQRYTVTADTATPDGQYEYPTSGVHDTGGQIGLCDLAVLPDGRLLALERSAAKNLFSNNTSIRTRIFLVDVAEATDISRPPYDRGLLDGGGVAVEPPPVTVSKALLFDGFVCDDDGENVEGLCLGRRLGEGRWAVIGVVDSGDGGLGVSRAALVTFELRLAAHPPPPATVKTR